MDKDTATLSNYRDALITRMDLNWMVDMERKKLIGHVKHEVQGLADETGHLALDARDLNIERVEWNGVQTSFAYKKVNEALGDVINVNLPSPLIKGQTACLLIVYTTSSSARALQFLTKEQTSDKKAPFLFSQCQAIHCRSIIPCQDTPSVKAPYTATVRVPAGLTCLMSAISTTSNTNGATQWEFSFNQSIAVPSYLVAIVVGVLESRQVGPRSLVWAEGSVVQDAANEFSETEEFLKAGEEICGPYIWKRYDLVVLPPTFPYGGMENPCLTFVTPTIMSGNKSLVGVVAHEIAHSWTGNLVTTCNWDHFWLNEGFTVYVERLILEKVYGSPRRWMGAMEGFNNLKDVIATFPVKEHTKLRLILGGIDPDDAFSSIPYEKGSSLLLWIEQNVLTEEDKKTFMKEHVERHCGQAIDTESWLLAMEKRYAKMNNESVQKIVRDWLYNEGMPPTHPEFTDTSLCTECEMVTREIICTALPSAISFIHLTAGQQIFVLHSLKTYCPLEHSKLEKLSSSSFAISSSTNCEILFTWLQICLLSRWEPSIIAALSFAKKYGRLKYCKKTYDELFKWNMSRDAAIAQFRQESPNMHPITIQQVEGLIKRL